MFADGGHYNDYGGGDEDVGILVTGYGSGGHVKAFDGDSQYHGGDVSSDSEGRVGGSGVEETVMDGELCKCWC